MGGGIGGAVTAPPSAKPGRTVGVIDLGSTPASSAPGTRDTGAPPSGEVGVTGGTGAGLGTGMERTQTSSPRRDTSNVSSGLWMRTDWRSDLPRSSATTESGVEVSGSRCQVAYAATSATAASPPWTAADLAFIAALRAAG